MSINVKGLNKVVRRKTFNNIRVGTSFVGSFLGHFGVWHKAGEVDLVCLRENGNMYVDHLNSKRYEPYESVYNYTKVNLSMKVESVSKMPGGG